MLRSEEITDAHALCARARGRYASMGFASARVWNAVELANVLSDTVHCYHDEAARPDARLDCLTTAVRALSGALRDRLDDDG